jgi:hypothetical protein
MLALALIPLAIPGVSAWGGRLRMWPLPAPELLGWLGVALSALGLGIRVAAMRQLGVRFSPLLAVQREHALETTGWYARVRHPGLSRLAARELGRRDRVRKRAGAAARGGHDGVPVGPRRREERLLEGQFGDAWRAYAGAHGRTAAPLARAVEACRLDRSPRIAETAAMRLVYHVMSAPQPLGLLLLAASDRGLRHVDFMDKRSLKRSIATREAAEPGAHWEPSLLGLRPLADQIDEFLTGARKTLEWPLDPHGDELSLGVWRKLRTVPFGETCTWPTWRVPWPAAQPARRSLRRCSRTRCRS